MIHKFDSLEDQLGFVDEATRAGERVKIRSGLEVEVADNYNPRGMTSVELSVGSTPPADEPVAEVQTPVVTDMPSKNANRGEWAAYAEALGHNTDGLTKAEIQKLFEEE